MTEYEKSLEYKKEKEMLVLAKGKDEKATEFILNKYRSVVVYKSRLYFLIGATNDDLIQEGMIGLYKAIEDFDMDKYTNFRTFAEVCIERQLITAVRSATRQKHKPLNSYVSFNKSVGDSDTDANYMELFLECDNLNPETMIIGRENKDFLELQIEKKLSELEKKVLSLYIHGGSYEEIGSALGKTEKAIDNALQRLKKKIEKILVEQS